MSTGLLSWGKLEMITVFVADQMALYSCEHGYVENEVESLWSHYG